MRLIRLLRFRYLVFKEQVVMLFPGIHENHSSWPEEHLIMTCTSRATLTLCQICQLSSIIGGAKRDRTADLLLARQALSQLSYGPMWCWFRAEHGIRRYDVGRMVGPSGLEPPASPLSGVRSNQLS
jgi:hypothetical protein